MTALYSSNAAPRPVRKIARSLPQVCAIKLYFQAYCATNRKLARHSVVPLAKECSNPALSPVQRAT